MEFSPNNIEFSPRQQQLIDVMIQEDSKSIRDFHGHGPGYDIFLKTHLITPSKEKAINNILKDARDLNPDTNEGFNKAELKQIRDHFHAHNRRLSDLQPDPSTHTMSTKSNKKRKKSRGKTKKRKRKRRKN